MKSFFRIVLFVVLASSFVFSQERKSITIAKTDSIIKIDGILNEAIWKNAEIATDFHQNFPFDTALAKSKTEVRLLYDHHYLYISAVCYDNIKKAFVIQSLKRDFALDNSDYFQVSLDPFNDKSNGFNFAVNPYGVQAEGMISDGGSWGGSGLDWDNKWYSHTHIDTNYWSVEMAIPFKSIRFKDNLLSWGINFARNDLKRNERSTWNKIPRNFNVTALAFVGELLWETPLHKTGANIALIPYVSTAINKNQEANESLKLKPGTGLDAKIAVTSSLNLDVTLNPDFSQVEVDRQVANLSRFSIFFPERRQFFIENSDLFSRFGFSKIRPFFSRKIGLAYNPNNFLYQQLPILGGARLSGKVDENWRIGAMTMQTARNPDFNLLSQNYSVFAVQRKVFARSNVGAILVNKQSFGDLTSNSVNINPNDFNRVLGLDYNIASRDNKWGGKVFWHQSFSPVNKKDQFANASWLSYSTRKVFAMWNHEYVGENYNAEVGFVPRKGYWRLEPMYNYIMYPKNSIVNNHGPQIYSDIYLDKKYQFLDRLVQLGYNVNFTSSSFINFRYNENYTRLQFAFDPTNLSDEDSLKLPVNSSYSYRSGEIYFQSNARKKLNFITSGSYGSYFNGTLLSFDCSLNLRMQPWGILSLASSYNKITLPNPYNSADILLVGPRFDLSLTKTLFITTFFQYNNQINNFNINARLQWRFRPVSDLFIVYTDNYNSLNWGVKNRALVIKLNYWFNL